MAAMPSEEQIARTIDAIYEVALEPSQWTKLLRQIGELVGAAQGSLMLLARGQSAMTDFGYDRNEEMMALFNARFRREDRWLEPALKIGPGVALTGQELCPTKAFEQTAYYQECMKPGEVYDCLAVVLEDGRELNAAVSFHRPEFLPPFGADEKKVLTALVPHLRRLVSIHRKLDGCSGVSAFQVEVLNRLSFGVAILSVNGSVMFMNSMAQQIEGDRDGLRFTPRGLAAWHPADDAKLGEAQKRALTIPFIPKSGKITPRGSTLSVRRPSLKRPYTVQVMPLNDHAVSALRVYGGSGPTACITITDPTTKRPDAADILASAYGLTPAEIEVTSKLGHGLPLRDVADELSIAEQTARWHLKNVLAKMDVSRQSELVSLLIQMTPPIG